jgi:hypothetical protein
MTRTALALSLLMAAVLVVLASSATGAGAQGGIGIGPVEVKLDDALRGGEYLRTLTIINQRDSDLIFRFVKEGEAAEWASLYSPDDPATPLDTIPAPANTKTQVTLRIAIPDDAPNGEHTGRIRAQSVIGAEEGEEGTTGVSIGVSTDLKVNVTGTQKLTGAVRDMFTNDVEVGYPLRINTKFQNTGNVKAQPEIRLQVEDSTAAVVGEASYSDTTVDSGHIDVIESEWDTTGNDLGDYVAHVAVSLGGTKIHAADLSFKILPVGTLTRQGVLEDLILENAPYPGAVAEITAHFRNTGRIDTRATFLGEVHHDSALTDTISTPERLVQPGEVVALEAFVDVPDPGDYTIMGKVNFEGKETEVKELTFQVGDGGGGLPIWAWAAIGGGAIVVVALAAGAAWRLRQRSPRSSGA